MDQDKEDSEGFLQELETIATNSRSTGSTFFIVNALLKFARIQICLSDRADKQTDRAHEQTRHIINLTRVLVGLTVALLLFTAYLSYDAYLKGKAAEQNQKDRSEPSKSNVEIHSFKDLP